MHDLTRLSVHAAAEDSPQNIDASLQQSRLGLLRDEHALLDVEELRNRGPADDPTWATSYRAMVEFAVSRSWSADDGRYLIAHIEREHP